MNTPTDDLFSPLELQARQVLSRIGQDVKASHETSMVKAAFTCCWQNSLTQADIQRVAEAVAGATAEYLPLRMALTRLVRAKVLRSALRDGETHWEVNY